MKREALERLRAMVAAEVVDRFRRLCGGDGARLDTAVRLYQRARQHFNETAEESFARVCVDLALLTVRNEPVTTFAAPAPACPCGAASTRAVWSENAAREIVSPIIYVCDAHVTSNEDRS
jgi:hypothetical protein